METKIFCTILLVLNFYGSALAQINEIDSPIENFEKLWKKFDERYANFELKEVDWDKVHAKYRGLVDEKTTNKKLFEVCCFMLQELNDGHVTIQPDFDEDDIECGPPYEFLYDLEFASIEQEVKFEAVINDELERNGFSLPTKVELSEDSNFQYRQSNSFGYLRLDEMTEKITFGKFKRAIDKAVKSFRQKKGLIIDLRFNGGGWDHNAYKLASRFVPKGKTIGHFERKRIKETKDFTKLKYRKVRSGGKFQFVKPIVILNSDFTASAAEVFILVMNELQNVTLIGDDTEGIFSDMYPFRLPNKWIVTLSHQQYFSQDMVNYEGKGIPPDIKVLNSRKDIENQTDPVLQQAINYLKTKD